MTDKVLSVKARETQIYFFSLKKTMPNKDIKIIPAQIKPPEAADSEVYISNTNESTGLHITHYKPVGGQTFSKTLPLAPRSIIEYNL